MLTLSGSVAPNPNRGLTYGLTVYGKGFYRDHFVYVKPWMGLLYQGLLAITLVLLGAALVAGAWRWANKRSPQS